LICEWRNQGSPAAGGGAVTDTEETAQSLSETLLAQCEGRRRRLGLSYAQLARRMGVSRAYVSKLMRGGAGLSIRSLSRLAAALDAGWSMSLQAGPGRGRAAVVIRSTDRR